MIVVTSDEIAGTARDASGPGWESRRMIVRDDGMGHSVHETRVKEGAELHLHYKTTSKPIIAFRAKAKSSTSRVATCFQSAPVRSMP